MKKLLFCILLFLTAFAFAQNTESIHIPDDFPVTDDILAANRKTVQIEDLFLDEYVFFQNKALGQTLAFYLATDYHRYTTYLFYNSKTTDEIFARLDFHKISGDPINAKERNETIQQFVMKAPEISSKYFTSYKGIALGDSKEKVLINYPYEPTITSSIDGVETYHWQFEGDFAISEGWAVDKDKPMAQNSFGHNVTMVFKNDKLIVMILVNEIP